MLSPQFRKWMRILTDIFFNTLMLLGQMNKASLNTFCF